MVSLWFTNPTIPLLLALVILIGGLVFILRRWGRPDRFLSRSPLKSFVADFAPILLGLGVVLLCASLVWEAYVIRLRHPATLVRSILPGFFASLLEDIVFFTAIGIIIFVVQRREFERGRKLEDRIDTLFNAKRLSSEELSDLKVRVRRIGCDFRRCEAMIDVREYDEEAGCLHLDISRSWYVASYLSDDTVDYDWRLKIRPDDIAGISPLMQIYPSLTRTHVLATKGKAASVSQAVELHGAETVITPEVYEYPDRRADLPPSPQKIEPGTIREFRSRYWVWQRLDKGDGRRDHWKFGTDKHWDSFVLRVTNSLPKRLRIRLRGKEERNVELAAGALQTEPLELTDWASGSELFVEFEVLE